LGPSGFEVWQKSPSALPGLPMPGVLTAPPAVFLELQTVGVVLLVLDRRVIPALALAALQRDDRFHRCLLAWLGAEKISLASPRRCHSYQISRKPKPRLGDRHSFRPAAQT